MHASFPSNIQPINAVHMAYKTLGSWQNMVGRVFGIHPYIAENQPHEVRTLGMYYPVGQKDSYNSGIHELIIPLA